MFNPGDVARFVVTWDFDNISTAQIVHHRKHTGSVGILESTVLAAVVTALELAWLDIDNLVTTDLTGQLVEMLVWDFVNNRWDGVAQQIPTALDGLGAGEYLPHGAAAFGKLLTDQARRQGRVYIPGFIEGAMTDGALTGANLTALADFLAGYTAIVISAGQNFEYCTFNVDSLSPLFETASLSNGSEIAESLAGYQRRRRPGVGLT